MHAKIQDLSLALVMCTQDQYHPAKQSPCKYGHTKTMCLSPVVGHYGIPKGIFHCVTDLLPFETFKLLVITVYPRVYPIV